MSCLRFTLTAIAAAGVLMGEDVDRWCDRGDCAVLSVRDGKGQVRLTGTFNVTRDLGRVDEELRRLVPNREVPLRHVVSANGWTVVVTAGLTKEFDIAGARLRGHLLRNGKRHSLLEDALCLLDSLSAGKLFGTDSDLILMSSTGEHSYDVRTWVWRLPKEESPTLLLNLTGLPDLVVTGGQDQEPGIWIQKQTYDGIHAETKGLVREFWAWSELSRRFKRLQR